MALTFLREKCELPEDRWSLWLKAMIPKPPGDQEEPGGTRRDQEGPGVTTSGKVIKVINKLRIKGKHMNEC